jgi:phosphoribosyl 1,2-cyclic phosphodiesterase
VIFEQVATGGCQSYLLGCPDSYAAALIDPEASQIDRYVGLAARHGLHVRYVIDTHTHADHILGIDDLRPPSFLHKPGRMPLYADPGAAEFLRNMFRYIFDADYKFGGLPQVEMKPIEGTIELFGARFEPVTVIHGETPILGFRFGSAAYLTDHSEVPQASLDKLRDLDILFLDALRYKPHPTHFSLAEAVDAAANHAYEIPPHLDSQETTWSHTLVAFHVRIIPFRFVSPFSCYES